MATGNPFSPRFGAVPPVVAGRREVLRDMSLVADGDFNSPSCASLLLGTRGMGKTTLLQVVCDDFVDRGWLALAVTARAGGGLLEDLLSQSAELRDRILHGDPPRATTRLSAVTALGFGASTERTPAPAQDADLRQTLATIGRHALDRQTGLLVTIDELQDASLDEFRQFGAIFQHESSRNRLPIVFLGAGLAETRSTLLSGRRSTFLHRCEQYEIGPLTRSESRRALAAPIEAAGATIVPDGLEAMLGAAAGHPYMLQTVGYDVWRAASDPSAGMTLAEVRAGLAESRQDMGPRIYGPIWRDLSPIDKRLLVCMLHDPLRSHVSDIAQRWDAAPGHVASYRHRLIVKGFVRPTGRGVIEYAHPEARRYVQDQSAEEGWTLTPDGTPLDPADGGPSLG
ncbi:MAG: ATP-binding protein [bacterium]|nr:ATP-binding protein [bacterium]